MAQHSKIAKDQKIYSRTDFAALRYRLLRIDPTVIFNLYPEDVLDERGIRTQAALFNWLDELRDHLIERARLVNPNVSLLLDDARRRGSWPKGVMDFIIQAGEQDRAKPRLTDSLSIWFKPIVTRALAVEHLLTVGDLMRYIEARGPGWYRPIPRMGAKKSEAFIRWLRSNQQTLGQLTLEPGTLPAAVTEVLSPDAKTLLPMDGIHSVVATLDGRQGKNRSASFCLISANNDLEAIQAYLSRVSTKPHTHRSYKRVLGTFLLWCVKKRRVALSDVLTDDCEAYKAFLANPDPTWISPRTRTTSRYWRPFAGPLAPESQRYAVQVIRGFFEWAMRVRYMGGNPWAAVADPAVTQKELSIAIDKALPKELWTAMVEPGGLLDQICARFDGSIANGPLAAKDFAAAGVQARLARATILLLGFSGLRREEACTAVRSKLKPIKETRGAPASDQLWELAVLGKRNKWRTVFLSARVIDALRAHWADRNQDFEFGMSDYALLSPLVLPNVASSQRKHVADDQSLTGAGFSTNGLYKMLKRSLMQMAEDPELTLSAEHRHLLREVTPHGLRHTFATHAAAKKMPIDVLQRLLGHASQQTTSIYVQAERARSIEEVSRFFS